jgi:hypothetical protein
MLKTTLRLSIFTGTALASQLFLAPPAWAQG